MKTVAEKKGRWVEIGYIAEKTGLERDFIYNLIGRECFIRPMRLGRKYLFVKKEADEWIEAVELSRLPESSLTAEQKSLVKQFKPFYLHR